MKPYNPTDEQRAVIDSADPVVVVLGGAGTGKTTTAAAAARAHLERSEAPPRPRVGIQGRSATFDRRVLFLSFSRASVARITERNRPILGVYRHRVEVTTFHALAWRFIVRFGVLVGLQKPHLTSTAEAMLFPRNDSLRYHDLVPNALALLKIPAILEHAQNRWSMIICDEFQDTDDRQYALLDAIRGDARLVLMGDPNQCIYASLPGAFGVSPERLNEALKLPGARRIDFPEASHRDPTGVIPAMAAAIRRREFEGPAVEVAIKTERLRVFWTDDPQQEAEGVAKTIEGLQEEGLSVAVFSHHNDALAALSDQLSFLNVGHEITGLSESLVSALEAQLKMIQYAAGECEWTDVLRCLAIFTTSSVRGRKVPALAYQILNPDSSAQMLAQRLQELRNRLNLAGLDESLTEAVAAHTAIGLPSKSSAWAKASQLIQPMLASAKQTQPSSVQLALAKIQRSVTSRRSAMLTDDTLDSESTVQLMNLHQTKGREADATVVILRANDFFGPERNEPFEEGSRLLYVVFSRARKRIVVLILGETFNPLVAPFVGLAQN